MVRNGTKNRSVLMMELRVKGNSARKFFIMAKMIVNNCFREESVIIVNIRVTLFRTDIHAYLCVLKSLMRTLFSCNYWQ